MKNETMKKCEALWNTLYSIHDPHSLNLCYVRLVQL